MYWALSKNTDSNPCTSTPVSRERVLHHPRARPLSSERGFREQGPQGLAVFTLGVWSAWKQPGAERHGMGNAIQQLPQTDRATTIKQAEFQWRLRKSIRGILANPEQAIAVAAGTIDELEPQGASLKPYHPAERKSPFVRPDWIRKTS